MKFPPIFRLLLWAAGGAWLLLACEKGADNIGQPILPNDQLAVLMVDTFTVATATVLSDSFATSADTALLVGQLANAYTGKLRAGAFASLTYAPTNLPDLERIRFDSLVLVLPYAFSYGDTTRLFSLNLHRLTADFDETKTYYNEDGLPYETSPLVSKIFLPRPRFRDKTLRIRMPDDLGQRLFDGLRDKRISDQETFRELLRGLALVGPGNAALLGFSVSNARLRLYYRNLSSDAGTAAQVDFGVAGRRFNQLLADRQGTPLAALRSRSDAVSSRATGNLSFVQPGAGLRTRLTLPDLSQLKQVDKLLALNRVELVIHPVRASLKDNTPPPARLLLYETNRLNQPVSPVYASGSTPVEGFYGFNSLSVEGEDQYVFVLDGYAAALLSNQIVQKDLLLTTGNLGSFEHLALGNRQYTGDKILFRVFYTQRN